MIRGQPGLRCGKCPANLSAMAGHFAPFNNGYSLLSAYYTSDEHGQPIMSPGAYPPGLDQFPGHYAEALHTGMEFEDVSQTMLPAQGGARVRRRIGASGEQIKFRRTRSGCYTCRNRRVKASLSSQVLVVKSSR